MNKELLTLRQYIEKRTNIISLLAALAGTYFLPYVINTRPEYHAITNPLVSIIIFTGFYFIIKKALIPVNKRKLFLCAVFGVLYSLILVVGAELTLDERLSFTLANAARRTAAILGFSPIVISFLILFISAMPSIYGKLAGLFNLKLNISDGKFFFISFFICMILWLPAFLAYYPGIFAYDAPTQLEQAANGTLTILHPLLHTWLLYYCVKIGYILGSGNLGIAIYSIIQMMVLAAASSYSLLFMRRLKLPFFIIAAGTVFLGLLPLIPVMAVSVTKDIIFSAFIVFSFLFIFDIFLNTERFFNSIFLQVRFIVMVCLMALFRNNGIFAFLFCIPFLIAAIKKHRIKLTLLCVLSIFLYLLSMLCLIRVSNAASGSVAEAFSVPIQQMARVYTEKSEKLDVDFAEAIITLLPDAGKYNPYISDPVKISFNKTAFDENTIYFIKLWIKLGIKYSDVYTSAFLMNTLWLWYPDMSSPCALSYVEFIFKTTYIADIELRPIVPSFQTFYANYIKHSEHQNNPVLLFISSPAAPTWILFFLIGICFCYKKYDYLFPLSFLFGLWIMLALSPIILIRYLLPLYLLMPLMAALSFKICADDFIKK